MAYKGAVVLGRVYIVGAGPGDPELLTVKALFLLLTADVVFAASLVPSSILSLADGKVVKCGRLTSSQHVELTAEVIEEAKSGKTVVVLKNGDPVIFGRGVAMCREIEKAGVPCEIVPGVSSFSAAAAKYRIPITEGGRPLLLTTARSGGEPDVVVFMPEQRAEGLVVEDLYGEGERAYFGVPQKTPALVFKLRQ